MLQLLICLSIPRPRSSYFCMLGILILSQCDRLLFVWLLFLCRLIGSVGRVFPIRFVCSAVNLHCIHDSVSLLWFGIVFWHPVALSVKMPVAASIHCHSVDKDRSSGGVIGSIDCRWRRFCSSLRRFSFIRRWRRIKAVNFFLPAHNRGFGGARGVGY